MLALVPLDGVVARLRSAEADGDLPNTIPVDWLGSDEDAQSYTLRTRDASGAREVRRLQGEVWQERASLLRAKAILINKPRHAGYEVDAVIAAPGRAFFVEIKTGCLASDFYGGVGQLELYPRLLPKLCNQKRVLVLLVLRAT